MKKKNFILLVFLFFGVCAYSQVPNPPVLLSPPNYSLVSVNNVTLDWSDVINATSYKVQVSIHQNFDTLIVNQLTGNISQYTIPANRLLYGILYYWRANATNQYGTGQWSTVWGFTTMYAPPPPPMLYSINGGNPVYADSITIFKWSHVITATSYRIQISRYPTMITPLIDSTITDTVFIVLPGTFMSGTVYYWRVAAISNGGQSAWTTIWVFTTAPSVPAPPVLIAPCDGINISLTPTLTWNASSGAQSYRVQVSNSSGFSNLIINVVTGVTTQYTIPSGKLNYDSTYFWRVNATNSMGTGNWSSVCHFTTMSSIGIKILSTEIPTEFKLYNNFPNPFNPTTKIKFDIPTEFSPIRRGEGGMTVLKVYDLLGKEIETLVNEKLNPGVYEVTFDASMLSSGVYYYRLTTAEYSETKKMILIK